MKQRLLFEEEPEKVERKPAPAIPVVPYMKYMCPRDKECPGYRAFNVQSGKRTSIVTYYCHDLMCPELGLDLKHCPCDSAPECEGTTRDPTTLKVICKLERKYGKRA